MIQAKFSLAAIISTTAIASSIVFTSPSSAQPCPLSEYRTSSEQSSQDNWLRSPLVAALALPGIALAVSLYARGRSYQS